MIVAFSEIRVVDVPRDLFLRHLLGDASDLVKMWENYGPLRVPGGLVAAADEAPRSTTAEVDPEWHWREVCRVLRGEPGDPKLRGEELLVVLRPAGSKRDLPTFLPQFAMKKQMLVALLYRALALTALQLPDLYEDAGAEAFAEVQQWWTGSDLPSPRTADQVVTTTSRILNLTTVGVGPRLTILDDSGMPAVADQEADLLSVLGAQILAYVSEGVPARRCAHEPCGRWFTHQQGRARYGQHRATGVQYCTARCARAAAQQRYRQRQRGRRNSEPAHER